MGWRPALERNGHQGKITPHSCSSWWCTLEKRDTGGREGCRSCFSFRLSELNRVRSETSFGEHEKTLRRHQHCTSLDWSPLTWRCTEENWRVGIQTPTLWISSLYSFRTGRKRLRQAEPQCSYDPQWQIAHHCSSHQAQVVWAWVQTRETFHAKGTY